MDSIFRSHIFVKVALAFAALLVCVAGCMSVSAPALAVFTRPYVTQIAEAPTGPEGAMAPLEYLGGIAIDPASGNIFVGTFENKVVEEVVVNHKIEQVREYRKSVDEFNLSNEFTGQLSPVPIYSLAFDDKSGKLEAAPEPETVAVDDSTDLFAGDVYDAAPSGHVTPPGVVRRTTSEGEPAAFTCAEGISAGYINANGELAGRPGRNGGPVEDWIGENPEKLAVDSGGGESAGYIYVVNDRSGAESGGREVDEFTSAGCFVGAIDGSIEVESNGKKEVKELFGPRLFGIAVDPTTGDVLVETDGSDEGESVIYEFASSGEYLGQINEAARGVRLVLAAGHGIAVSPAGDLYVDACVVPGAPEPEECETFAVDEFGPGASYPQVVTGAVRPDEQTTATLTGTVNDEERPLTECYFEYVEAASYKPASPDPYASGARVACEHPDAAEVSSDSANHAVHADIEGLTGGTLYDFRLVATTNPAVPYRGGTKDGQNVSFAAAARPVVEAASAGEVSSTFVRFGAKIDPVGSATTYMFEYVDAADYTAALAEHAGNPYAKGGSVPAPAGEIGEGDEAVAVSVPAGGLSPGTVYDYRVVASNGVGATDGANGTFATVPASSPGLPDGRRYELVTPPNKGDGEDMFGVGDDGVNTDEGYASEDGEHFMLWTASAFGPFPAAFGNVYVFSRGADGWSFQALASPSLGVQSTDDTVFDPWDFSAVGVREAVGYNDEQSVGLEGPPGGPYATLATSVTAEEPVDVVGDSEDASHVLLESREHKLPLCEAAEEHLAKELDERSTELYEWTASSGCLTLVGVKSLSHGGGLLGPCGAVLGSGQSTEYAGAAHGAVSPDGSEVIFTAPDPVGTGTRCWEEGHGATPPQVYMRVDGETTVEVSAPQPGGTASAPAVYVGSGDDGTKVFFVTRSELTKEAVELGTKEPELYEYDTQAPPAEQLVRVSRGEKGVEGNVESVPAISPDGTTVYFNAGGDLALGGEHGGLYRYDTETGTTTFVAPEQGYTARPLGADRWFDEALHQDRGNVALDPRASYFTTADGAYLLFESSGDLTGYESDGQGELYRYHVEGQGGSIVCVSCNPSGTPPSGTAEFARSAVNHDNPAGGPVRAMSENGEYVFFDTAEALVPSDTNHAIDVYEWHDGTISLISTGQDALGSYFLGSSAYRNSRGETVEGGNVFFGTHSQLVPQDTDSAGDLYDARIDGGFSTNTRSGACEGDACDNPPSAPPNPTASLLPAPPGTSFGEVKTEVKKTTTRKALTCRKGFTKKKNKCVRVKKRARKASRSSLRGER